MGSQRNNSSCTTQSVPLVRTPTEAEMNAVFQMCRQNRWNSVLDCIRSNHLIPITSMIMDNHISTTILHQAITSKGDTKARARVIREILDIAPKAAAIKNGYGSLPLHVISQRNTKLDAPTKELLIGELVNVYKGALVEQGGVGKRTPLHIIFTDYISPRVTNMMVRHGAEACFMQDKKGYLPAHVACSRHVSPEKLEMLLKVNPNAMTAKTSSGDTLLSLAVKSATPSHPNFALIDDLKRRLGELGISDETNSPVICGEKGCQFVTPELLGMSRRRRDDFEQITVTSDLSSDTGDQSWTPRKKIPRRRKVTADEEEMDPATLLLHFSRQQVNNEEIKQTAIV